MLNKEYKGSLCTGGLDPILYTKFRGRVFIKNGTLNGVNTKELVSAAKTLIRVKNGELEVVEMVDPMAVSLLTHTDNTDNNRIMRKNEKTQLNRVSIDYIDKKDCNLIKHFLIDTYGTIYGKISPFLNEAMKLHLNIEDGFLKLVETNKKPFRSFISDEEGQFNSIDGNSILGVFEFLTSRVIELQNDIKEIKESTVQSASNISFKVGRKVKKIRNGKGKSGKAKAKLDKAERILNNLKKRYEHRFTNKDYKEPLAKLEKQGDPRTPVSDLEALKAAGLIKKVRSGVHGVDTYEFTENDLYHLYNSDLAKIRFFDDVREKFFMDDEFRVKDLNKFIFEQYELFDAESQNKRLRWLLAEGLVRRHDVNPSLLKVQK